MTATAPRPPTTQHSSIEKILHGFLSAPHFTDPELVRATRLLHDFVLNGGKRLRPTLCCLGYSAVTGRDPTPPVLRAAASLELFHAFALIHDDVMDQSATRRGVPTLHHSLGPDPGPDRHPRPAASHRYPPSTGHDGICRAILVGDLAFAWSDQILHSSGLTPQQLQDVRPLVNAMRTEVMGGQYLDVAAARQDGRDLAAALRVIRHKTAKYTIERPLHLGAILGGATEQQLRDLTDYALPLGEAFQLRDDLLGVFGDPAVTGKSRLDDLREGKRTVLMALALRAAAPTHQRRLHALWGKPDLTEGEAQQIRHILTVCHARTRVEAMIDQRRRHVLTCLDACTSLTPDALARLRHLADSATRRTR
ncbi:geranylgeranyl pyrophosphate synthase [Streptomyces spiroverticillatus]|uniref:Geranylgeranyl pyrophosphate synthase n=1 Tax=Streptomyces finlayi TaxID=67296 RepID=A0A919CFL0_9ACTN|nr:polyprenyl synthetase family protein [Streptomyces finlayi]GHA47253.1 geranylgeranyl pyrophosphate synthase [Streptomyces spiroverticillatus]GHD18616.1 geranylgeranyl pyrophosphate synthase [Streptomyces finlayi]